MSKPAAKAKKPAQRPLTRRQRQMLRDAYEHARGRTTGWSYRPCPKIGDLRVLNGLTIRGLMTDGDNDDTPHEVEVWPRWIRITPDGVKEWDRILAERALKGGVVMSPVTPETLTDEMIREVEPRAFGRLYLACLDATTSEPTDPRHRERWERRRNEARKLICHAINVWNQDGAP